MRGRWEPKYFYLPEHDADCVGWSQRSCWPCRPAPQQHAQPPSSCCCWLQADPAGAGAPQSPAGVKVSPPGSPAGTSPCSPRLPPRFLPCPLPQVLVPLSPAKSTFLGSRLLLSSTVVAAVLQFVCWHLHVRSPPAPPRSPPVPGKSCAPQTLRAKGNDKSNYRISQLNRVINLKGRRCWQLQHRCSSVDSGGALELLGGQHWTRSSALPLPGPAVPSPRRAQRAQAGGHRLTAVALSLLCPRAAPAASIPQAAWLWCQHRLLLLHKHPRWGGDRRQTQTVTDLL